MSWLFKKVSEGQPAFKPASEPTPVTVEEYSITPQVVSMGLSGEHPFWQHNDQPKVEHVELTIPQYAPSRREYLAGKALQGFLSDKNWNMNETQLATHITAYVDALIAQLDATCNTKS